MALIVSRKPLTFKGKVYEVGDRLPHNLLDSYQRETFLRVGIIVEKTPTEVKPVAKVKIGA